MVQIICGEKGKGKTKHLLERVNDMVKKANGNVVYIDKNTKKMYELSNKIRLINVRDFPISNSDEFLGFICGIISQDHDLEEMFLDSFLTISNTKDDEIDHVIRKLEAISDNFHVNFVLSVSKNSDTLSDDIKDYIVVDL
ncbi:MAG: twitching motility protein PilT [Eubacterium sp.]|nr:twitching motility protein PilT [Eubacterium sp.]